MVLTSCSGTSDVLRTFALSAIRPVAVLSWLSLSRASTRDARRITPSGQDHARFFRKFRILRLRRTTSQVPLGAPWPRRCVTALSAHLPHVGEVVVPRGEAAHPAVAREPPPEVGARLLRRVCRFPPRDVCSEIEITCKNGFRRWLESPKPNHHHFCTF